MSEQTPMKRLRVYESLWGMEQLPGEKANWSIEERVDAALNAGFDGVAVEVPDYDTAKAATDALRARGSRWTLSCFPKTVNDLVSAIEAVVDFGQEHCDHINLQPKVRPHTVRECVPLLTGWQRLADEADIPLCVEHIAIG